MKVVYIVGFVLAVVSSQFSLNRVSSTPPPVVSNLPQVLSARTQTSQTAYQSPQMLVQSEDARPFIIKNYLSRYESPLEPYYQVIVNISDKYSLDYRLLVAIAQQESNLCKKIPPNSHNCWGFGIYGDLVTRFDNYPQALETVAKALKRDYLDKGLDTPEKIMAKYTPPSIEKGGPWAKAVTAFFRDLE